MGAWWPTRQISKPRRFAAVLFWVCEMIKQEFAGATLYLGDCAGLLPAVLAENKVDALISDPPYVLGASGAGMGAGRKYLQDIKNHIDTGFDVNLLDNFDNWLVFCAKSQIVDIINRAKNQDLNWMLLTWNKKNPTPLTCGTYLPDTEYMVHAYRRHIWESKTRFVVGNVEKNPFDHPTVKPLYVMYKAIASASAPGDLVLDPFMGTGSTGVAALQRGRCFIGIEREPKYFDIACQRIEHALAQGQLF